MKWYKFLVYFALIASAILHAVSAFLYMSGEIYNMQEGEGTKDLVYTFFPDMKSLNIFYGICLLGLAVLAVFTWIQLKSFKKTGPTCLLVLYGLSAVVSCIYFFVCKSIVEKAVGSIEGFNMSSVTGSLAISIVMIIVNYIYFNKRKSLFTN